MNHYDALLAELRAIDKKLLRKGLGLLLHGLGSAQEILGFR